MTVVTVIAAIVFFAVLISIFVSESWMLEDFFDWLIVSLLAIIGAGFASGAVWLGLTGAANYFLDHKDHYYTNYLATLQDNTGVEGAFVLGSGSVSGVSQYSFYVDYGGYKKAHTVNAGGVRVYEEDVERAYVLSYGGCELSLPWLAECFSGGNKVNELHVPKGTVKTNMVLDAK